MNIEREKDILKTVEKGDLIMIRKRNGGIAVLGRKVDDHGEFMIVDVEGIDTPVLYCKLWHNKILEVEQVIAKMEGLPF